MLIQLMSVRNYSQSLLSLKYELNRALRNVQLQKQVYDRMLHCRDRKDETNILPKHVTPKYARLLTLCVTFKRLSVTDTSLYYIKM